MHHKIGPILDEVESGAGSHEMAGPCGPIKDDIVFVGPTRLADCSQLKLPIAVFVGQHRSLVREKSLFRFPTFLGSFDSDRCLVKVSACVLLAMFTFYQCLSLSLG